VQEQGQPAPAPGYVSPPQPGQPAPPPAPGYYYLPPQPGQPAPAPGYYYYPPPQPGQPAPAPGYYTQPQRAPAPSPSPFTSPLMRDNETIWGLSFTLVPSASIDSELFYKGTSLGTMSDDLDVSFGIGAFGAYRINKFVALGGDFDFFLLNPKNVSASIKTLSLGPELRLTLPVNAFEFYLRFAGGFAVSFLPDALTKQSYTSNVYPYSGSVSFSSFAPGYLLRFGPGVMYRTEHMGLFLGFDVVFSKMYLSGGDYALDAAPNLFGLQLGAVYIP
jgi:hypothetical protein